jgi:hypothetical protein
MLKNPGKYEIKYSFIGGRFGKTGEDAGEIS